jgi:preprotein translocase subunit SecB
MAEETTSNGADGTSTTAPAGPQQLILNAQYIKDLSFENPRAPQSLIQQTTQPDVEINVDVKANNLGPEVFEVVLTINATARAQGETVFLVELAYGSVVTIKNATAEQLPMLVLVDPANRLPICPCDHRQCDA